jgi:peptide/nickel transport system substrate-binding protein
MPNRRKFLFTTTAMALSPYVFSSGARATPKNVVVLGKSIDGIVNGFDPAEAYDMSADVLPNLYRTLVTIDPRDPTKLVGDLSQRVETSPDGMTYRFYLKTDAMFESGKPVTARDVVFSIQRAVKLNRSPVFILAQLGWNSTNVGEMVRESEPDVITIKLPEVRAGGLVLASLSSTVAGIVEEKVVMANEKNGDMGNEWLRTHSAGAGSYRLVDWQASDHIILQANPHAANPARTPRLAIRHMPEPAGELLLLRKGDLDVARTLGSDELKAISGDPKLDVVATDALTLIFAQMNMAVPQFQKPEVRQAIKWSIDYDAIATHVTPGLWNVWQSFLPKGTPGALTEKPFRKDISKAKALMKKAGYENGFSITLDHPNTWPYPDIAQALQASFAEIGIQLQLLAGDTAQILAKRRARQHQMQITRFSADHIDPSSFASYFCPNTDDSNDAKLRNVAWGNHFVDPKLTAATFAAGKELDVQTRLGIYKQMQRDFWESGPMAFILQKRDVAVVTHGVSGLEIGPVDAYTHYSGIQKS